MFTPDELSDYLHRHIPVSAAMGVSVASLDWDGIQLAFPLQPNLNHNATAFGGSLSSALMLAGWSLTHARLRHLGYDTVLVVSRCETRFRSPVEADFKSVCRHEDAAAWEFFRECLDRKGRAKLRVECAVREAGSDGPAAASMKGAFVAMLREPVEED